MRKIFIPEKMGNCLIQKMNYKLDDKMNSKLDEVDDDFYFLPEQNLRVYDFILAEVKKSDKNSLNSSEDFTRKITYV